MQTKELIKILQQLVENHKCVEDIMGEHEIMVDVFQMKEMQCLDGTMHKTFQYAGFSPEIKIQKSSDGVYDIICGFVE